MTQRRDPASKWPLTVPVDRAVRMAAGTALALALLTAIGQLMAYPNADVSWNLYVTRSLMAGAKLGVDVFENSPPMIFLLKAPAVALADLGGWREWPFWVALVVVFAAVSVALSLPGTFPSDWPPTARREWWVAIVLVVLIVVPGGDFGQRDHVMTILVLPYLVLTVRRIRGDGVSRRLAVFVGATAAVGIGIKPHFALLPVALWLLLARRGGSRAVLTPENATVGAVGAMYIIAVALVYPEYFTYAATYGPLYQRFHTDFLLVGGTPLPIPPWAHAALWPGAMAAYIALGAYAAVRSELKPDARDLASVLGTATAALLLVALIQGKGWWYHFLPAVSTGTLLIAVLLAGANSPALRPVARLYLAAGAGTVVVLLAVQLPQTAHRIAGHGDARLDGDRNLRRLLPLVTSVGAGGHVGVFSTNMVSAFPLVLEGRSRSAFRHPSLWPLVAFYENQVPGKGLVTVRDYTSRRGLERQFTQDVVDDLVRAKPELLLVLRPDASTNRWGGARRFDYLGYFGTHPTFRDSVLPSYAPGGSVGDYDVYWRKAKARVE